MSKDVKSYALKKDDFVSVSLDMVNVQSTNVKKAVDAPIVKEIEKPVVKEEEQEKTEMTPQKKEINIDNLFSQIWTKDIKKEDKKIEKEIDKRVMQELSKKSLKSTENKVESVSSKIEKVNSKDKAEKDSKSSTGSEVNEYFAKIQAIVYQYFTPPENSQGKMVKAVIELDSFGKVIDFRILTYSDSDSFNSECDKIKGRLTNVLFPKNPDNKSGTYKINLISQE
ncbi:TonB C-terminal domain-containing protein [Sulfurimonas denitrificans]|nr:TonB C-terminal domain-containing protein [Sulfurimonas denitrificans]MDD3442846.1 TonB C-terminal domain-containing protein [Sulfurimonas denitrificans]